MDSGTSSPFKCGYWIWDEVNNVLQFVSRDATADSTSGASVATASARKTPAKPVQNEMKFRETLDKLETIKFRKNFQRRCKPNEPHIVSLQDVKDVALYLASAQDLTPEFVTYFHIPVMDRFLRALIIYFQYYLQVWEKMMERREEAKHKIRQPVVTLLENTVRDDLSDLRSMVAREYRCILLGSEEAIVFHHMNNQNNDSLSDKDRRLFEVLICMAVRVVWIALQRRYLTLIELEMHRLLRSDFFNVIIHRGLRSSAFNRSYEEERVLSGTANIEERKLLQHSPVAKELTHGDHDHRMLGIGVKEFQPRDERLDYLEAAFSAPEEHLLEMGVRVGLLGIPRADLDPVLLPKERKKDDINKPPRALPEFKMPARVHHVDDKVPSTYPKSPPRYTETSRTIQDRKQQCRVWKKSLNKNKTGRNYSVLDLSMSLSQSHILTASVSSLSTLIQE